MTARIRRHTGFVLLLAAAMTLVPLQEVLALRFGGEGNAPIKDPGWPKGAAVIFNTGSRIAYWELNGSYHSDCRGDAQILSEVLADFAKLDVKNKQVFVYDGVGQSEWLNIGNDPARRDKGKIDWTFLVWIESSWQFWGKRAAGILGTDPKEVEQGPPSRIDVYTGGNIKWADVIVPKELTIVDQRLEAHGFALTDGVVLEGKVTDLATKQPLAAKVRLERHERQPNGTYRYPLVAETVADAKGQWVFKKAPEGWLRVVVEADGFVSRVAGGGSYDDQPRWQAFDAGLSRSAPIEGRVTDDAGQPLADVEVRLYEVTASAGGAYQSPRDDSPRTDKEGRFRVDHTPIGRATIGLHKPGYVQSGSRQAFATPKNDVELKMMKAASVEITVDFTDALRPQDYIVKMTPEGGDKIGSYGGTTSINAKNQVPFADVPPGRYVFTGRPNPGSDAQETVPVTVDLKGGQSVKVTLKAK